MSEDTRKQQKGKRDPKEQRKRRGRQHQPSASDKKTETESHKNTDLKEPEKPDKSVYEPPPPEFYKNLKRETDEILKITEEANSKYKKKEILSNWSKYEMPIESYDEIDEQENLGADYETLSKAPLSIVAICCGHFQFKHEKSWDANMGPSLYDKYFDINMENLNIALSTIPFFERNTIDQSLFSEIDIQSMNHRATKFKQKYYKDKKYTTPELEAQERILNSLVKSSHSKEKEENNSENNIDFDIHKSINGSEPKEPKICLDRSPNSDENTINTQTNDKKIEIKSQHVVVNLTDNIISEGETIYNPVDDKTVKYSANKLEVEPKEVSIVLDDDDILLSNDKSDNIKSQEPIKLRESDCAHQNKIVKVSSEPAKNPVIESPEDLEQWLDDFLDG